MTTFFNNNSIRALGIAVAVLVMLAIPFVLASAVHAADYEGETWGDYYPSDSGYGGDTWGDYYPSDSGFSDSWYEESFSGGGGFGGGGFTGGWSMPTRSSGGGMSQYQSLTNTNTNVNENYCTNGSCNTSSSVNAPTNIISYAPPAQTYSQPNYPVYTAPPVYTQPAYYPAQRPVAYNSAPYVTLAAVPYTGFELGFWGTIAYWGFLVLWCLIAAYLIVVKKIQNKIAAWFTGSPQNSTAQKSSDLPSSGALRATPAGQTFVRQNFAPKLAGIDPFIQAQINRAK